MAVAWDLDNLLRCEMLNQLSCFLHEYRVQAGEQVRLSVCLFWKKVSSETEKLD